MLFKSILQTIGSIFNVKNKRVLLFITKKTKYKKKEYNMLKHEK